MPSIHSQKAVIVLACLALLGACLSPPADEAHGNGQGGASGTNTGPAAVSGAGGSGGVSTGTSGVGGSAGVNAGTGNAAGNAAAGASASGVGGGAAGTEGTAGSTANDAAIDHGNYFKSGAWMGYVWTSASGEGSTITPMDFEGQTGGMPRCVTGTVAALPDFSGTAILGFDVNEGAGATGAAVAPTKQGVLVGVRNNAGSQLRLQVQTASTGGTQWCTTLVGAGGFIPWANLRTECWGPTGMKYDREPIVSVMLLVPGKDTTPVDFDFCVDTLAEADAPSGGMAGAGAGAAGAGGSAGTMAAGMGGDGGSGGSGS